VVILTLFGIIEVNFTKESNIPPPISAFIIIVIAVIATIGSMIIIVIVTIIIAITIATIGNVIIMTTPAALKLSAYWVHF